jgi:nucleotide-binding universal stress UspA family protein
VIFGPSTLGAHVFEHFPPKSVVVGIDGSQAAIRAALWAVDEVAGTDIPLRLLYIRQPGPDAGQAGGRLAMEMAEEAVYDAYDAINALGKPVKVEMEIVEGSPVPILIEASRSTLLLCIGDIGSGQSSPAGFGSTATALVHAAHCSVAVIRGDHDAELTEKRSIVAHVDGSADDQLVLEFAFEEAHRRNAPLVLMTARRSGFDDLQSDRPLSDRERCTRAMLDRYVALWKRHYPEVDVRCTAAQGPLVSYLAEHPNSIQLLAVGATQTNEVQQLLSPIADRALQHSNFALLIVR